MDNGSNNSTFIKELIQKSTLWVNRFEEEQWNDCFAHVINLAVQSSLEHIDQLTSKVFRNF